MKIRRIAPGSQTTATRPRTPSAWVIGHSKLCLVQVVRGFFQKRIRKASEPNGASLGIGAGGRRRAEADIARSLAFTESPFILRIWARRRGGARLGHGRFRSRSL